MTTEDARNEVLDLRARVIAHQAKRMSGVSAVDVLGGDALAARVRSLVVDREGGDRAAPGAVVVTDPLHVQRALELVQDLGAVLLCLPRDVVHIDLDLYADLHVRGITVVGIPEVMNASRDLDQWPEG